MDRLGFGTMATAGLSVNINPRASPGYGASSTRTVFARPKQWTRRQLPRASPARLSPMDGCAAVVPIAKLPAKLNAWPSRGGHASVMWAMADSTLVPPSAACMIVVWVRQVARLAVATSSAVGPRSPVLSNSMLKRSRTSACTMRGVEDERASAISGRRQKAASAASGLWLTLLRCLAKPSARSAMWRDRPVWSDGATLVATANRLRSAAAAPKPRLLLLLRE